MLQVRLLHKTVEALSGTEAGQSELGPILTQARSVFQPKEYDCLGCPGCYPAIAANAFADLRPDIAAQLDLCPTGELEERGGWPPLPGDFHVIRYGAPVAVCTLNSEALARTVADRRPNFLRVWCNPVSNFFLVFARSHSAVKLSGSGIRIPPSERPYALFPNIGCSYLRWDSGVAFWERCTVVPQRLSPACLGREGVRRINAHHGCGCGLFGSRQASAKQFRRGDFHVLSDPYGMADRPPQRQGNQPVGLGGAADSFDPWYSRVELRRQSAA